MSIPLTNRQATEAKDGLSLLGLVDLDIDAAFVVAIQKRCVQTMLQDIADVQKVLFDKHGKKDEKGNLLQSVADGRVTTQLENPIAFQADWDALMHKSQSIDAPVLKKSMLAGVKVKPDALFLMGPLFSET